MDGRTYVLTVFVGDSLWPAERVDAFCRQRDDALEWLQRQASRYGKNVTFVNASLGTDKPVAVHVDSGTGSGSESVDVIRDVVCALGYASPLDFVEETRKDEQCRNCLVLVAVDKPGRGYSVSFRNLFDKEKYFLEGAVLYTHYHDGRSLCAASVAHEICHLFGADDLYETFEQTKENEEKARRLFPNDIMLRTSFDIDELNIGRLTAWYMGLTDACEPWFLDFCPQP